MSLGRMRLLVGPLSWLAHAPLLARIPLTPSVGAALGGVAAVVATTATVMAGPADATQAAVLRATPPTRPPWRSRRSSRQRPIGRESISPRLRGAAESRLAVRLRRVSRSRPPIPLPSRSRRRRCAIPARDAGSRDASAGSTHRSASAGAFDPRRPPSPGPSTITRASPPPPSPSPPAPLRRPTPSPRLSAPASASAPAPTSTSEPGA